MSTRKCLREVFAVLGNRLYLYESGKNLVNNPFRDILSEEYPFEIPFDYEGIMDEIAREMNFYDPVEVYKEADYYAGRTQKVIKSLQVRTYKVVWDGMATIEVRGSAFPVINTIELSHEEQENLFHQSKKELTFCYSVLKEIMTARSHVISTNDTMMAKQDAIQINLPEKLTIKKLQKHYDPYFSPIQAAWLLQCLKDLQAIPPYGPTDIGRLGELLFGRNQKVITDSLREIEDFKLEADDYKNIQRLVTSIVKEIEKNLNQL